MSVLTLLTFLSALLHTFLKMGDREFDTGLIIRLWKWQEILRDYGRIFVKFMAS